MTEKTQFRDLAENDDKETEPIPTTQKACANCRHGRPETDQVTKRALVRCKAGPPSAQVVQTSRGMMISAHWPALKPSEECDAFVSKHEPEIANVLGYQCSAMSPLGQCEKENDGHTVHRNGQYGAWITEPVKDT